MRLGARSTTTHAARLEAAPGGCGGHLTLPAARHHNQSGPRRSGSKLCLAWVWSLGGGGGWVADCIHGQRWRHTLGRTGVWGAASRFALGTAGTGEGRECTAARPLVGVQVLVHLDELGVAPPASDELPWSWAARLAWLGAWLEATKPNEQGHVRASRGREHPSVVPAAGSAARVSGRNPSRGGGATSDTWLALTHRFGSCCSAWCSLGACG